MKTLGYLAFGALLLASCGKVTVPAGDGSVEDSGVVIDAARGDETDADPCDGEVDSCGVCDGADTDLDCAGTCFGTATVDMCEVCDDDASNDCVQDCDGVFGGTATEDDCGTCDSDPDNDCWADGVTGTITMGETGTFDFGSGAQSWSLNSTQRGFYYARPGETNPTVRIANIIAQSPCTIASAGYDGENLVTDVTNAAALNFSTDSVVINFGTRNHPTCNQGLMVFRQGTRFGVIDFLDISNNQLTIRFWLGNDGVTDFSGAPL